MEKWRVETAKSKQMGSPSARTTDTQLLDISHLPLGNGERITVLFNSRYQRKERYDSNMSMF